MCTETTQHFYSCLCTIVRTKVCISHVEHTHQQIDNNPCPRIEKRFIETRDRGCDFDIPCEMKKEEKWVFAGWKKGRGDRCFVENCTRPHGEYGLSPCSEEGGWRTEEQHDCGMGKGWKGEWRHLNPYEDRKRQIDIEFERRLELRGPVRKKRDTLKRDVAMKEDDCNSDSGTDIIEEDRMDTDVGIKEEGAMEE